jgi:hypothetical protein
MPTVKSKNGTTIAYDRQGSGPALIIVDGALEVGLWASGRSWRRCWQAT